MKLSEEGVRDGVSHEGGRGKGSRVRSGRGQGRSQERRKEQCTERAQTWAEEGAGEGESDWTGTEIEVVACRGSVE